MARFSWGAGKDAVFKAYQNSKTNMTLEERFDEGIGSAHYSSYLYICNEFSWNRVNGWFPINNYSKIGTTSDAQGPWGRLRVLQQGNPRDLKFTYLYVGRRPHVDKVEKIIKDICDRDGEWIGQNHLQLKSLVDEVIDHFGFSVWLLDYNDRILPYSATSKGNCILKDRVTELNTQILHLEKKLLQESNEENN